MAIDVEGQGSNDENKDGGKETKLQLYECILLLLNLEETLHPQEIASV